MAKEMGYDESHLFMRSIQFEFATEKKDAGKAPPLFITAIHEDDSAVDRWAFSPVKNKVSLKPKTLN